jgi:hypothetical protein
LRKVYLNGTIAIFNDNVFDYFEHAPDSFIANYKRFNYTDGSYTLVYEESGRKVFYPPAPKQGLNSTYEIACAILSIEDLGN